MKINLFFNKVTFILTSTVWRMFVLVISGGNPQVDLV